MDLVGLSVSGKPGQYWLWSYLILCRRPFLLPIRQEGPERWHTKPWGRADTLMRNESEQQRKHSRNTGTKAQELREQTKQCYRNWRRHSDNWWGIWRGVMMNEMRRDQVTAHLIEEMETAEWRKQWREKRTKAGSKTKIPKIGETFSKQNRK